MSSPDIQTLLRRHADRMVEVTDPVTFDKVRQAKEPRLELATVAARELKTRSRLRGVLVAVAAAVVVLVVIGGTALLLGDRTVEEAPADQPSPVIEPPATAVPDKAESEAVDEPSVTAAPVTVGDAEPATPIAPTNPTPATSDAPIPTTMSPLDRFMEEMGGVGVYEFGLESLAMSSHLWSPVRVPPLEATLPDGSLFELESFTRDTGDTVVLVWAGEVDGMRLVADEITLRHLGEFQEAAGSPSGLTHGFVSVQVTDATAAEAGAAWDGAGYSELPLATLAAPPWGIEARSLPAWVRLDPEAQFLGGFAGRVELEGTMVDLVPIPAQELLGESPGIGMARRTRLPVGEQYLTPGRPLIGLTAIEDFWYAGSISCDGELDYAFLRYFELPTAEVQIGPLRGEIVLADVAGLYAEAMGGAQVTESVVGEWPALRVEGSLTVRLPEMPGVRMGPSVAAGASVLFYVADTGMGTLYVLVSAESADFDGFAERAQPLIDSLTIESDAPWVVCQ